MNRRLLHGFVVLLALGATLVSGNPAASGAPQASSSVTIPFEWVNRHMIVKVSVNNSRPLPFIFDSGATPTIIKLARAKELGLKLHGEARGGGAGAALVVGSQVSDAKYAIPSVPNFSAALRLAMPLDKLAPAMGQDIDGIIGGDFIKQFVVEIDYEAKKITLHDNKKFRYTGPGDVLSIGFNPDGHPFVQAEVTPTGGKPISGSFMLDTGSGGALVLHTPFVNQHGLLDPPVTTIRAVGLGGAGGEVTGRIGRVGEVKLGRFAIAAPVTLFAQDRAGAFANPLLAGNIGGQILSRFRVFLDYGQGRIILEPTSRLTEPFDRAFCGFTLRAEGPNYTTFRIRHILENSPATDAGLQIEDVITAVNGKPAAEFTLAELIELFERPVPYELTIGRGEQSLKIALTPRKLI